MGPLPSVIRWRRLGIEAGCSWQSDDGRFTIGRGYSYGEPVYVLRVDGRPEWYTTTRPGFRLLRNAKARAEEVAAGEQ